MFRIIRHIFLLCVMAAGLSSCIYEHFPVDEVEGGENRPDRTLLVLNIRPIDANATAATAPAERVKTVRVIIVNTGDAGNAPVVECNRIIKLPEMSAAGFYHTFNWITVAGTKQIYVIANEDYVAPGFSTQLGTYAENAAPRDLTQWLSDYYFEPNYTPDAANNLYLPYTYYNDAVTAIKGQVNNVKAYLAPVATKFIFNFYNYRPDDVMVSGISVDYINKANYLFAHVGPDDTEKEFDGTYYPWPEWLALISDESWNNTGFTPNDAFNKLYGWITDYTMPDSDDDGEEDKGAKYVFRPTTDSFTVDAGTEIPGEDNTKPVITPGSATVGPVYVPESKNLTDPADESTLEEQMYYLTLGLIDTAAGSTAPDFTGVPIPNLKALFRNTYVIINVKMSRGDIEVYAQIADWNQRSVNGWLTEGTAPSPNPFAKPLK